MKASRLHGGSHFRAPAARAYYAARGADWSTATDGAEIAQPNASALFDSAAAGLQIGATQTLPAVAVAAGTFTVQLDFGVNAFPGANRLGKGIGPICNFANRATHSLLTRGALGGMPAV